MLNEPDILDNSETMRRRKAPKINWCKPLGNISIV